MFQHTAARRRLLFNYIQKEFKVFCFNTQPRGGGCLWCGFGLYLLDTVSTHSRAEAAAAFRFHSKSVHIVSTHSRAEAAALLPTW